MVSSVLHFAFCFFRCKLRGSALRVFVSPKPKSDAVITQIVFSFLFRLFSGLFAKSFILWDHPLKKRPRDRRLSSSFEFQ
jgi:hypothetical protein